MLDYRKFVDLNKNYETAESFSSWLFANHEVLKNLGLLAAGIIGLLLLIWRAWSQARSSKAAQKQAENAEIQLKNVEKQNENASKSHVADTYTKAIEQLGAVDNKGEPNLELRLGGLYALEKIAQANEDYHRQIMEVLCAYVRMNCPKKLEDIELVDPSPEEIDSDQIIEPPRIDIQACLTVISRRENSFDKGGLDLSGVEIKGVNLKYVILNEVNLYKANLMSADLRRASLKRATLRGADLRRANLKRADFNWANLTLVNLCGTNLYKANLISADLFGANLSGAKITGAKLSKANLKEAKNLTCEQINSADIDGETKVPEYMEKIWDDKGKKYTCEMVGKSE